MEFLYTLWNGLLDTIFGKSDFEEKIRTISQHEFLKLMRPIEQKDGAVSLFRFENHLIREMIFALKYRKNEHIAKLFGFALATHLAERNLTSHLLIPIPLSKKRHAERGFNQIELVLSQLHSENVSLNTLIKTRETAPQTALHRTERLINLEDAFSVTHASIVKGKDIVLLDDVTTTGATLREASKALKSAGAKSVHCIALAR